MKLTLCFASALSLSFTSCSTFDPDYAEYKKQKEAQTAAGAQSAFGPTTDLYGTNGLSAKSPARSGPWGWRQRSRRQDRAAHRDQG
jgi:hypothetical protein